LRYYRFRFRHSPNGFRFAPTSLIALFFFIRVVRVIRMLKATSQFISATSGGGLVYNTQIVSHKEE
jgi:hypothetical protein